MKPPQALLRIERERVAQLEQQLVDAEAALQLPQDAERSRASAAAVLGRALKCYEEWPSNLVLE